MSKQHFEQIAKTIKTDFERAETFAQQMSIAKLASNLADDFAQFNPRFDRSRFLAACGIKP